MQADAFIKIVRSKKCRPTIHVEALRCTPSQFRRQKYLFLLIPLNPFNEPYNSTPHPTKLIAALCLTYKFDGVMFGHLSGNHD